MVIITIAISNGTLKEQNARLPIRVMALFISSQEYALIQAVVKVGIIKSAVGQMVALVPVRAVIIAAPVLLVVLMQVLM